MGQLAAFPGVSQSWLAMMLSVREAKTVNAGAATSSGSMAQSPIRRFGTPL